MNILLSLVLAFYPATLVWQSIPVFYIKKLEALAPMAGGRFFVLLIVYGLIFYACYRITNKLVSRTYSGGSYKWMNILIMVLTVILAIFIFYVILPGGAIYPSPHFISQYILQSPYNFLVIILPLIGLFFY